MTGSRPDTRDQPTRPISVAELLAKNGTIGSPPVTGRRRRRRGNSGAVTVAELTGENPVIRVDDDEPGQDDSAPDKQHASVGVDVAEPVDAAPAERGPEPEPAERDDDGRRIGWSAPGPRWPKSMSPARGGSGLEPISDPRPARRSGWVSAEPKQPAMFPVVKLESEPESAIADAAAGYPDLDAGSNTGLAGDVENAVSAGAGEVGYAAEAGDAGYAAPEEKRPRWTLIKPRQLPEEQEFEANPYVAEPDNVVEPDHVIEPDHVVEPDGEYSRRSELVGGAAVVLQSIVAVAFGAGLFIGFDQLWRWNSIVALVLAMLVTLGLAAAVRLVRKTDDISSTLTAVAVGLLVTLGPLALHAS